MEQNLTPSDVEGLAFQSRGVLVNTDRSAYDEFVRRRRVLENKDREIADLQSQINTLNEQMALILSRLPDAIGKIQGTPE